MTVGRVRAILAHDAYWGIGRDGDLPWKTNSEDLQWFKQCTTGGIVVMGRRTWDSLPRRPLPGRTNVVITSGTAEGADVDGDMRSILKLLPQMKTEKDVWIIGGANIVEQMLPYIEELWLNDVGGDYRCDTFLPRRAITEQYIAGSVKLEKFGIITKWIKK